MQQIGYCTYLQCFSKTTNNTDIQDVLCIPCPTSTSTHVPFYNTVFSTVHTNMPHEIPPSCIMCMQFRLLLRRKARCHEGCGVCDICHRRMDLPHGMPLSLSFPFRIHNVVVVLPSLTHDKEIGRQGKKGERRRTQKPENQNDQTKKRPSHHAPWYTSSIQ
ncbi:hypothetical protein BC567DRAFT_76627 [Phyllosticta citribraziliensis]